MLFVSPVRLPRVLTVYCFSKNTFFDASSAVSFALDTSTSQEDALCSSVDPLVVVCSVLASHQLVFIHSAPPTDINSADLKPRCPLFTFFFCSNSFPFYLLLSSESMFVCTV